MTPHFSRSLDASSVAAKLGLCAAALAGTAATVSDANAAIVTSTTPISIPATIDGVYINFLTGGTGTSAFSGWDFNPYLGTNSLLFYWGGDVDNGSGGVAASETGPYLDLAVGSVVSSASTFSQAANGASAETAAFLTTGTHTLGFEFLNEATGATDYGYLRLSTTGATGFPATILGWSYDNTGAAITVAGTTAAVPEPAPAALFALGALALGASQLRRVRRQGRNAS